MLAPVVLAAAALAAGPPEDLAPPELEGEPLWARAGLRLRFTAEAAVPTDAVLFDPATNLFAASGFLAPQPADSYPSALAFVSVGLNAASWLDFRLDVDSGLVRSQQLPASVEVCLSSRTLSGLETVSPTTCRPGTGGALTVIQGSLPSTLLAPAQITSNGQPILTEFDSTLFIRQLYADVTAGRAGFFRARVGRQRLRVAEGIVYDDWGLGVDLDVDAGAVGPPVGASLSVFYPTRGWPSPSQWASPVVAATLDWLPSLGEWVGLWGAFSHDDTGDANAVLREGFIATEVGRLLANAPGSTAYIRSSRALALLIASPPRGTSNIGWAGVSGHIDAGDRNEARFTAGACFGSVSSYAATNSSTLPNAVNVPVLGWEVSLRWLSVLGGGFRVSPFFLWLSGDDPAEEQAAALGVPKSYSGFLSISPFITTTNLFFQGGISEAYADRELSSSGVNARGVITPGMEAGWTPTPAVDVVAKAAFLWSDTPSPYGGRVYGPELDLNASWSPWPWLAVLGEADFLAEGNFFPTRGLGRRFILGVDLTTP